MSRHPTKPRAHFVLKTPANSPRGPHPLHDFSQKTTKLLAHALSHGWADSTLNKYTGAVQQFLDFCEVENVPSNLRFPANEFVLCAYAASSAGVCAGGTTRNKFAALKAWHHIHNEEWNGSMRLRIVLNGVKNLAPKSSLRPPRPPINATMLSQLVNGLELRDPLDAAVAACAVVAFWGQGRLGELLSTSCTDFGTSSKPSRNSLRASKRSSSTHILFLPRTKTKRHGEQVILTEQRGVTNPLVLLQSHLKVNNLAKDSPLFAYTTPSGPRSLTKRRFLARCNSIWSQCGYPRTTGHSFRIGGTTELLLAGVPPDIVKTTGRWSSDAFLRYWRFLEDIAPQYTRNVTTRRSRKRKASELS